MTVSTKLDQEKIYDEIKKREEHVAKACAAVENRLTFLPFGYTGAGKTTFILYSYGIPLKEIDHMKFAPEEQLPPELQHLEIGQTMNSCTIYISATAYKDFLFLDCPGFDDVRGLEIDIANVVAMSNLFKRLPRVVPILFIDFPLFSVLRGSKITKLIQAFSGMFNNNTEILKNHMIVVWTKVPAEVSLAKIQEKVEALAEIQDQDHGNEVKEILYLIADGISNTLKNRPMATMAGRVTIFRPADEGGVRRIQTILKNTKQISNPGEVFVLNPNAECRTALENSLNQLRADVPTMLENGETEKLAKHLLLLRQLSEVLPVVNGTLEFCAGSLRKSVETNLINAKERLDNQLAVGIAVNESVIGKFIAARTLLESIEELRQFFKEPLESLENFDQWTQVQFEQMVKRTEECTNFVVIGANLKKMKDLSEAFYYLAKFEELHSRFVKSMEKKVLDVQANVNDCEINASQVEVLAENLQNLQFASEQVAPYINIDCRHLNEESLRSIRQRLVVIQNELLQQLDNQMVKVDKKSIEQFQALKAAAECKKLNLLLTSEEQEGKQLFSRQLYEQVHAKCLEKCGNIISQIKVLAASRAALDPSSERFFLQLKCIGELDISIKQHTDLELAKVVITFDHAVDGIIENLKNKVLYRAEGPSFKEVPLLLRELDSCAWLSKYSFSANRLDEKKKEAIAYLNDSMKNITKKIGIAFLKGNYEDAENLYTMLECDLNILEATLPSYNEEKEKILQHMQNEIEKKFEQAETKACSSLAEGDAFLGLLSKLSNLSKAVGLEQSHSAIIRKIKENLRRICTEAVDFIIRDKNYAFDEYRARLDKLFAVRSKTEFPNLDENMRLYEPAKTHCVNKLMALETNIKTLTKSGALSEIPHLVEKLEDAAILSFHIPEIMEIVKQGKVFGATSGQDLLESIKSACKIGEYGHVKEQLGNMINGSALQQKAIAFLSGFLYTKVAKLKDSLCLYQVFNAPTDDENRKCFVALRKELEDMDVANQELGLTLQQFNFSQHISDLYQVFDETLSSELESLMRKSSELGFQEMERRLDFIKRMIQTISPKRLPGTASKVGKIHESSSNKLQAGNKLLDNIVDNIEEIDQMCTTLAEQKHPKAREYLLKVNGKVAIFADDISRAASLAHAKVLLEKLQYMHSRIFFSDLKQFTHQCFVRAKEWLEKNSQLREEQFDNCLVRWDVAEMQKFFSEYKDDKKFLDSLKTKINNAIVQQLALNPRNQLALLQNVELLTQNYGTIIAVRDQIHGALNESFIQQQTGIIKAYAKTQCDSLSNLLSGGFQLSVDKIHEISKVFVWIIDIKAFESILREEVISEKEFASLVTPILTILGNNKSNLEMAIARCEFFLLCETFKWIEMYEPLLKSLRKYFTGKTNSPSLAPLQTIVANCVDLGSSRKMVEEWLNELLAKSEKHWNNKEFTSILQIIQGIQSGNSKLLNKTFPNIESSLQNVLKSIEQKYEHLCRNTERDFDNQNWNQLREGLATLEGLAEVEVVLNKKFFAQLKQRISEKVKSTANVTTNTPNEVAHVLIELNILSQDVPQFSEVIKQTSNQLILNYGKDDPTGEKLYELGLNLQNFEGPHGKDIVSSFKAFSVVNQEIWAKKTSSQDIEWALSDKVVDNDKNVTEPRFAFSDLSEKSKGSIWSWSVLIEFCKLGKDVREKWKTMYMDFQKEFKELYDQSILKGLDKIVEQTKDMAQQRSRVSLPSMLAHICVIWSRKKSGEMLQGKSFRLEPHPVQVLCFFRLLEKTNQGNYFNQLIEVPTGEGKSVILGVTATYFALMGFDVSCICYSEFLSSRDFNDFLEVFEALNIVPKITYSTITNMCEKLINHSGNVRELAKSVIESASGNSSKVLTTKKQCQSILLIDEVDVFFGSDFYGNTYNPAALISNDNTYEIVKFIFNNSNRVDMNSVSKTQYYLNLVALFPKLKLLIDQEIKKMLKDVKEYENTPEKPIVTNGIIYYKDQDSVTCKKVYGYKTAFQYFQKYKVGEINNEKLVKDHVGIFIGVGNFSFAEVPTDFTFIMGVSGTLRSLTAEEQNIVQSYNIQRLAYAPSIYGSERTKISAITMLQSKDEWFMRIIQNSEAKQTNNQAVFVFFENITVLEEFRQWTSKKGITLRKCNVLEEKEKFKETIIKQSTVCGSITLCTRPFGRGVDFICRDSKTKAAGGVHVIQTFVACSEAEQIQIKGRTARQGDPGSHEFLLFHGDLIKYLGTKDGQPEDSGFKNFAIDSKLSVEDASKKINRLRDELYKAEVLELATKRKDALVSHKQTKELHQALLQYDGSAQKRDKVTDMIMKINQASLTQAVTKYHLFFCLDESGSMGGSPWQQLMIAVNALISKRITMCHENCCTPEDLVTVVNYASSGRIVFQNRLITTNPQSAIDFRSGGTDFAAGLNTILPCIRATTAGYSPCLIFMSDGGCSNGEQEMKNIRAQCPNLVVFVVGFGSGCDRNKLTNLANLGGGQFFYGADGLQLKGEFEAISVKLSGGVMAL